MKRILVLLLFASPLFAQTPIITILDQPDVWTSMPTPYPGTGRVNAPVTFGLGIPDSLQIDCPNLGATQVGNMTDTWSQIPGNEEAPTKLGLFSGSTQVTSQFRCTARWPDGKAKWVLVDYQLGSFTDCQPSGCSTTTTPFGFDTSITVKQVTSTGGNQSCTGGTCSTPTPLAVDSNPGSPNMGTITVSTTGSTGAVFVIQKASNDFFHSVVSNGTGTPTLISATNHGPYDGIVVIGPSNSAFTTGSPNPNNISCYSGPGASNSNSSGPTASVYVGSTVCDGSDATSYYTSQNDTHSACFIEDNGPLRAVVMCQGNLVNTSGSTYAQWRTRYTFWALHSDVEVVVTLRNANIDYTNGMTTRDLQNSWKEVQQAEVRLTDNLVNPLSRNFHLAEDGTNVDASTITSQQYAYIFAGFSQNGLVPDFMNDPNCGSTGGEDCINSDVARAGPNFSANAANGLPTGNRYFAIDGFTLHNNSTTPFYKKNDSFFPVGWADLDDGNNGIEVGVREFSMYWPKSLEFRPGNTTGGSCNGGVSPYCQNFNEIRVGLYPNQQLVTQGTSDIENLDYCVPTVSCSSQYVFPVTGGGSGQTTYTIVGGNNTGLVSGVTQVTLVTGGPGSTQTYTTCTANITTPNPANSNLVLQITNADGCNGGIPAAATGGNASSGVVVAQWGAGCVAGANTVCNSQPFTSYYLRYPQYKITKTYWNFHAGTQSAAVSQNEFLWYQHPLFGKPSVYSYWNSVTDSRTGFLALLYPLPNPVDEDTHYNNSSMGVSCPPGYTTPGQCLGDVGSTGFAFSGNRPMNAWWYFDAETGGPQTGSQFDQRWAFMRNWLQRGYLSCTGDVCTSGITGSQPGRMTWAQQFYQMIIEHSVPRADAVNSSCLEVTNPFDPGCHYAMVSTGVGAGWRSRMYNLSCPLVPPPSTNTACDALAYSSFGWPQPANLGFATTLWNQGSRNWLDQYDGFEHSHWDGMADYYFLTGDEWAHEDIVQTWKDVCENPFTPFANVMVNNVSTPTPGHPKINGTRAAGTYEITCSTLSRFLVAVNDPDQDTKTSVLNVPGPAIGTTTPLNAIMSELAIGQEAPYIMGGYPSGFTEASINCGILGAPLNKCSAGTSPLNGFAHPGSEENNCSAGPVWAKATNYTVGQFVIGSGHYQFVTVAGESNTVNTPPTWSTSGGSVSEGPSSPQLTWQDRGTIKGPCLGSPEYRAGTIFQRATLSDGAYQAMMSTTMIEGGTNWHIAVGPAALSGYIPVDGATSFSSVTGTGVAMPGNIVVSDNKLRDMIYAWSQFSKDAGCIYAGGFVNYANSGCMYAFASDYPSIAPPTWGATSSSNSLLNCSTGCHTLTNWSALDGIAFTTNSVFDLTTSPTSSWQLYWNPLITPSDASMQIELGSYMIQNGLQFIIANGSQNGTIASATTPNTALYTLKQIPYYLSTPSSGVTLLPSGCSGTACVAAKGPSSGTGTVNVNWTLPTGLCTAGTNCPIPTTTLGQPYLLKYFPCQLGVLTIYGSDCPANGKAIVADLGFNSTSVTGACGANCNITQTVGGTTPATSIPIGSTQIDPTANQNFAFSETVPDCGTSNGDVPCTGYNPNVPSTSPYSLTLQPNVTYNLWLGAYTSSGVSLSPASCSFRSAIVGIPTTDNVTLPDVVTACTLTLKNNTATSQTITSTTYAGDFGVSGSPCTGTLTTGASCSFTVAFTPTATGSRTGSVTVVTSVDTVSTTFTGTGLASGQVCLIPPVFGASCDALYTFVPALVGVASSDSPENTVLSNTSGAAITPLSFAFNGTNPTDFSFPSGNTCGSSLANNATCNVNVTFTPTAPCSPNCRTANLALTYGGGGGGSGPTAASCNTSDVAAAIALATEGQTVKIPPCPSGVSWTSGITVSGKGVYLQGSGAGRIIAISSSTLTIGTGSKTLTITSALVSGALSITNGESLKLSETGNRQNFMLGTVTSYSSGTLVMNITSTGGFCGNNSSSTSNSNCARWLISTIPQTVLINNSSTTMFALTEDSTVHTTFSGIKIAEGTGAGDSIDINGGGGAAIVVENCWIEQNLNISIHVGVNRGVISNCSFDSTPFSIAPIAIDPQPFDTTAWATPSYWGNLDTNGQHALYVETNDFHAYLLASDNDEGARTVYRYNLLNNAGLGGHGVDTGPIGARYFELYNNVGVFNGYSSCSPTCYTFPMNQWYFLRGGSFVVFNNTLPALVSTDYGTKGDLNMIVMNLQRNAGPTYTTCWGNGTTGGADYYAPHQVGLGYINGTGHDGHGNTTYSTNPYGYGNQPVGDSEPGYIWNNSRVPLGNTHTSDYGTGNSDSCTGTVDTSANYIVAGRDYFNGSTAKPGYTPYTYPHPLTSGGGGTTVTSPLAGTGLPNAVSISPTSYGFNTTVAGSGPSSDSPFGFTVTNNSGASISGITATISGGANPADFAAANVTCTGTIGNGNSCVVSGAFVPLSSDCMVGSCPLSATLSVSWTGGGPITTPLSGTATATVVNNATAPCAICFVGNMKVSGDVKVSAEVKAAGKTFTLDGHVYTRGGN